MKQRPNSAYWSWYGEPAPRQLTVEEPKGRVLDAKGNPVHRVIGFRPAYVPDDKRGKP